MEDMPSMTGDPDEPWFCLKCDGHNVEPVDEAPGFVRCRDCGAYTHVAEHFFVMNPRELGGDE